MAQSRRGQDDGPSALPIITPEDVRARRAAGQLGRVDVYPIPESRSPDAPSAIVRSLPESLAASASRQHETEGFSAGYRLNIDGRSVSLTQPVGVIGRGPDVVAGSQAIAIDDPGRSLSRSHLGFELDARNRLMVFDLGSANGSEIITTSDERIECVPPRRYPISVGDTLLLGNFSIGIERG